MKTIKKLIEEFTGGIRTLQSLLSSLINPLTTDDECTRHASLAACYQLAQSVLKIGFALAKRWDRGRWPGFSTWCRACGSCLGWL